MNKIIAVTALCSAMSLNSFAFAQSTTPEDASGQSSTSSTTADAAAATRKANAEAQKAEAERDKAVADARKSASESEEAAYKAEAAAKAAKNGAPIGQTGITGAVQVGDEGPKAEATLLVSKAALDAAERARVDLATVLAGTPTVLVITSEDQLATAASTTFNVRRALLKRQLTSLDTLFATLEAANRGLKTTSKETGKSTSSSSNRVGALAALTVADQALSSVTKVGSWFQSDYSFKTVTVDATSELYAEALNKRFRDVHSSVQFVSPTRIAVSQEAGLIDDLGELHDAYAKVAIDAALATKSAADRRAQATADKTNGADLLRMAVQYEAFAASAEKVLTATDTFVAGLFTENADKVVPIAKIAQEREARTLLQKPGTLVLLISGKPVAAYYTKKNLWTWLGGAPLYTMGGASISYKLFNPTNGEVKAQGVALAHGGYRSVGQVEKLFEATKKHAE